MRWLADRIRSAWVCAGLSYRALFNWTHPFMYTTTLIISPLFQMIFFTLLGRFLGIADANFYVIGNAVLAVSGACLFGSTMAIANERRYRTLGAVVGSPGNRVLAFGSRGLPYVAHGMLSGVLMLACGAVLLGFRVAPAQLPLLLVVMVLSAASCSALGLALGAVGLRFRDVFVASNIAQYTLVLVSGAQVPRSVLPAWLQTLGRLMPLTAGIQASRMVAARAAWGSVWPWIAEEAAVLVVYSVLAIALMAFFEEESRRAASLDVI
jgi:ABC-2 type transport system permease protein